MTRFLSVGGALVALAACGAGDAGNATFAATTNLEAATTVNVAAPKPGPTPSQIADWAGRYEGDFSEGGQGEVNIAAPDANGSHTVRVSVTAPNGCGGQVSGRAKPRGDLLTLTARSENDPQICTIAIRRNGSRLTLEESGCLAFHGAQCRFDGSVTRIGNATPSTTPTTAGPSRAALIGDYVVWENGCGGALDLGLNANGTYDAYGERGVWSFSGSTLTVTTRETFEMGEPGSERRVANARPVRHRVELRALGELALIGADGQVQRFRKCS